MLIRLGRSAEAIQLAQDLLAQEKSSSHLYYLLGKAYQKIGKQTEAIHTLNRAIEMDTDHVEARLLREQLQDH
ncbi:MAG: tetratricopeptide repeat protein [Bacteroidota bacterium]